MRLVLVLALLGCVLTANALELGTPFSDGAVLQREMRVPVWGRARAGNEIAVSFAGQTKETVVRADGTWRIDLDPLVASCEGREIRVVESEPGFFGSTVDERVVRDVLVGEVWFASGQSNMECPIWYPGPRYRDRNGQMIVQMTKLPLVRFAKNQCIWRVKPEELKATWLPFTREGLMASKPLIGSVAFYYARELHFALGVPIGIVDSSWGGTNIDAWTPRSGYRDCDPSIRSTADYPVRQDYDQERDGRGPINGPMQQPTVLWNAMVASWAPMAMRGMIWYQGCHNSREPELYCAKMHALYNGWSREFGNPSLKFYFVQLAPFRTSWLPMVQAQNKFVAEEKNAAIAVLSDVGNFDDIHPNDKDIVAKRLVVHALKRDYGFPIDEDDSPVLKDVSFDGGKARLSFVHVKSWFVYARDASLNPPFEMAGKDGVWYPADLCNEIVKEGNQKGDVTGTDLILVSEKVADPVRVRYMGQDRTCGTLFNEMSLPLGAFETP